MPTLWSTRAKNHAVEGFGFGEASTYGAQQPTASESAGSFACRGDLRLIWIPATMDQAASQLVDVAGLLGDRLSMLRPLGKVVCTVDAEAVAEIAAPSIQVVRQQQCLKRDREVEHGVGRVLARNAGNETVQRQVLRRLWLLKVVPLEQARGFDYLAEVAGGEHRQLLTACRQCERAAHQTGEHPGRVAVLEGETARDLVTMQLQGSNQQRRAIAGPDPEVLSVACAGHRSLL